MGDRSTLTFRQLLVFFIPLGFSASLTSVSHVVINGTLTRGDQAELIIASYAIAHSIFMMMERPVFLLRQTTSALVKDMISFKAMFGITTYVLIGLILFSSVIAYTPVGYWFFSTFFDADENIVKSIINVYRILLLVSIFSAYRCLYQGVIINRLQPKWLTVSMIIRLSVMLLFAFYFIWTENVNSAMIGGIIFLVGMFSEYVISYWKGRQLLKQFPYKLADHAITNKTQAFRFYSPMLFSGGLAVIIIPAANATMGNTMNITLAIASFALAMSILQLALSFFMYFHQIVLQFYDQHPRKILRWSFYLSLIPCLFVGVFSFTPIGFWFLHQVMGASESLSEATLFVLRMFIIKAILFPWIDFCNGILMLRKQTNVMILSQIVNVAFTIAMLLILVGNVPHWNGMIGALAVSVGVVGELAVVIYFILKNNNHHLLMKKTYLKTWF